MSCILVSFVALLLLFVFGTKQDEPGLSLFFCDGPHFTAQRRQTLTSQQGTLKLLKEARLKLNLLHRFTVKCCRCYMSTGGTE